MAPYLAFNKMQALGNDFVVLDGVSRPIAPTPELIRRLAHRRLGVGCDQVLLVEPSERADFRYRIFNADGSEVGQCGNGARCLARFIREQGLSPKNTLTLETASGFMAVRFEGEEVAVDMGPPRFAPQDIPFLAEEEAPRYALEVEGRVLEIGAVSMGNPHAVLQVEDAGRAGVEHLGPLIEAHPRFPAKANVGFMEVLSPDAIRLRVFERGVGETPACGSGACAAVAVGRRWGLLGDEVTVALPGGALLVRFEGGSLWLRGPAVTVFEGRFPLG